MFSRPLSDKTLRTELTMNLLKTIEKELIRDWHQMLREERPYARAEALKAYYVKFRLYQLERSNQLALGSRYAVV